MLFLCDRDLKELGYQWKDVINVIREAVECIAIGDFAQPIKPYLRFGNKENRIIAMPAYIGGRVNKAGIKWISSFPQNVIHNIPRASCITVLNDAGTGNPIAVFNSPLISIVRTVAVSGYVLQKYIKFACKAKYNIGIIGWGPIGQTHLNMCKELLGDKIGNIYLFDIRGIDLFSGEITICESWKRVYEGADILITCTSSLERHIDLSAKREMLVLDISLRDFCAEALDSFALPFIVDDWSEVNREDTDIEYYTNTGKLCAKNTITLCDILNKELANFYKKGDTIFFAPMGMGVFDISIADYFYRQAVENMRGMHLN